MAGNREAALLAECAEFLDGIGLVSPAFDRQVEELIARVRDKSPVVRRYMDYCSSCRDANGGAKPFGVWLSNREG